MVGYRLLADVRVVEVAQLAPSSLGGHLADLGADVIKIESGAGDGCRFGGAKTVAGEAFLHLRWNRGKRSLELDLRSEAGKATFLELVASADVVVEGTRAGYLDWLGLGFERMRERNPAIVFCAVSGTGSDGPYRDLGTGGLWFDAYSGISTPVTGAPSPPGVMGGTATTPIAMYAVGAYGAMGVLAALHHAKRTREGVQIEVASIDVATAWMPDKIDAALNEPALETRTEGWTPDGRLTDWVRMEPFVTRDGGAILLGAHYPKFWKAFCHAVDRPDLLEIDDLTYDAGHDERSAYLWGELRDIFATRTKREWVELFLERDIGGGPVNTVTELLDDPHFTARANTYRSATPDGTPITLTASPIRLPGETFAAGPAPTVGQHTAEVLAELDGAQP